MIKLIIGGIGSGKSVTAIKEIFERDNKVYINFNCALKNTERLKTEHIIKEVTEYTERGKPIVKQSVNYEYWHDIIKKGERFDIIIDEAHNVLHSRRSMTKWNTLFSMWLAQIRKLLGSNEANHLYLISQRVNGIDVAARDLAGEIIYCYKKESSIRMNTKLRENYRYYTKRIPITYIFKIYFTGSYAMDKFIMYLNGQKTYDFRGYFRANDYFKFYDSYQLIDFGDSVYV